MQQVLFWIPLKFSWFPEGIPVYAYGAMLFLTFVCCVWFLARRAAKTGVNLSYERAQDMAIVLFVCGLAGARLTYMLQFGVPLTKFFRIWEGGIVLLGGIVGGVIAFILFHRFVLRKLNISLWQLADLFAPALALGIALGRVGCLLNGCCYGTVANSSCPAIQFPLLTAPAREMLAGLQTAAGFSSKRNSDDPDDVRTIVDKLESGSAAEKAGLKEGDKIVKLKVASEWKANGEVLMLSGKPEVVAKIAEALKEYGSSQEVESTASGETTIKITVDEPKNFRPAYELANVMHGRNVVHLDLFNDMLNNWPRGRNSVQFVVERGGEERELPAFTPRSLGLHPTQIYETISMLLVLCLLLAFYPFRRHDGQVWVLFMVAYSFHRILNEMLRTEPVEALTMTLSQIISVLFLLAAIGMEIYLRKTQPKRS